MFFFTFREDQCIKTLSKLGTMTNVGKNRLVKKLSSQTFTKLVIYVQTFLVDTL